MLPFSFFLRAGLSACLTALIGKTISTSFKTGTSTPHGTYIFSNCLRKEVPVIRLLGKQIGFALPQNHVTIDLILREMKKLLDEGADLYPLLFEGTGPPQERICLENKLTDITGRKAVMTSFKEEQPQALEAFDLLVIAPCPGNMLMELLNASGDPDTQVKALTHLQTERPIVLALVANGSSGDLVGHIEQILTLKSSYLIPIGVQQLSAQFIITRLDLINETVVHAFMHRQNPPVTFQHHWLPS